MRIARFLLAFLIMALPAASFGQIAIRVAIGPPALPSYDQPICPGDGYLWTPGYWAYDESISDYYWVPGTWVEAPEEGYLWTPGYWGWGEGGYFFNEGYWGPTVGFYGGINYGFGYWGGGYEGGRWDNGHFFYNRSVNNVNTHRMHNVYNETSSTTTPRTASATTAEEAASRRAQTRNKRQLQGRDIFRPSQFKLHMQTARANPEQRAAVNHGTPAIAATAKPGDLSEQHGAARANEATDNPSTEARAIVHPKDLPPIARPAPIDSGNAKADRKYAQQQDKLIVRQTQERQNLQQRQDVEHQQLTQQKASDARTQQVEQQHQQQTQQLSQRHAEQQQTLQSRQPQARPQDHSHEKH